jgi:hypothetical protein
LFIVEDEPWLYESGAVRSGADSVPFLNEPTYRDFIPRPAERSGAVISGAPHRLRPPAKEPS